jgi:hypothetical protein
VKLLVVTGSVGLTKESKSAIIFEDTKGIRKLYKKRQRSGKQIQTETKLVVFLRVTATGTVQGRMGRHSSLFHRSKTHQQALSDMRRVTPRGQVEQTEIMVQ